MLIKYKERHSLLFGAIVIAIVCLFIANAIALAQLSNCNLSNTTLAAQSRLKPFFEKCGLDFQDIATLVMSASELKNSIMVNKLREGQLYTKIGSLNKLFRSGEIEIEKQIKMDIFKCSQKEYKYAVFHFKKAQKTINVLFLEDHANLTLDELKELRIEDMEKYHLDCPGLEGVWFINSDSSPQSESVEIGDGSQANLKPVCELQPPAASVNKDMQKIIQEIKEERALIQRVHSRWSPAITMFGSARIPDDDPMCAKAQEMGAAIYREGLAIRTGAGPSLMEAPLRGYIEERRRSGYAHGKFETQGIRVKLPFEQRTSSYVEDNYTVNHFVTRKMALYNNCLGIIAFPGGFGTMDELFEVWFRQLPVVLVGTKFWGPIIEVFYDEWRNRGWLESIEFKPLITDSVEEAIRYLRESKGRVIRETPGIMESANSDIESSLIRLSKWLPGVTVIGQSDFKSEREAALVGQVVSSLLSQGIPVRSGTANHELKVVLEKAAADKKDMLQAVLAVPENVDTPQLPNRIVTHHISNHHVLLAENSRAFIFLPGRIKTLSRLFNLIAVMQTGKVEKRNIILVGKEFWQPIKDSIIKATTSYPTAQLINPKDADLFQVVDTAEEAVEKLGLPTISVVVSPADMRTCNDEAERIHIENLRRTPGIPEKTILCHIIADSILPEGQRNILKILEQNMRGQEYSEKVVSLSVNNPANLADELMALMAKQRELYNGYNINFDVACPDIKFVNAILESNTGVKALAFEPSKGAEIDLEIEGIILALRALNSGKIESLREAFTILSGKAVPQDISGITDVDEFIKRITFILPASKVIDYNDRRRLNEIRRKNIEAAA